MRNMCKPGVYTLYTTMITTWLQVLQINSDFYRRTIRKELLLLLLSCSSKYLEMRILMRKILP